MFQDAVSLRNLTDDLLEASSYPLPNHAEPTNEHESGYDYIHGSYDEID